MIGHVVWDWNGTLLDDIHLVVDSVNAGIEWLGVDSVTLDTYRTHYQRPVQRFYEAVLGRQITAAEWREIDDRFHRSYATQLAATRLRRDAFQALGRVRGSGARQSLLSMYPHDELLPLVRHHGIESYFDRIDGLRDGSGARKATYLEAHMFGLFGDVDPSTVLVIGDTPDDADAARHSGASVVLVDGGNHHIEDLSEVGVPVAHSLMAALDLGLS